MKDFAPRSQTLVSTAPDESDSSRREKIYAVALACFQRKGIARTTMDDIARAAGLSRPAIYYYFKDKQSLIVEAVIRQQAETHRIHRQQLLGRFHGIDAILEAAALSIERAPINPYSALLMRPENEHLTAIAMHSTDAREVHAAFWTPLLADARERGELRVDLADSEIIAWMMFLNFSIVANGRLLGITRPDRVRQTLAHFLVPALRGATGPMPLKKATPHKRTTIPKARKKAR